MHPGISSSTHRKGVRTYALGESTLLWPHACLRVFINLEPHVITRGPLNPKSWVYLKTPRPYALNPSGYAAEA